MQTKNQKVRLWLHVWNKRAFEMLQYYTVLRYYETIFDICFLIFDIISMCNGIPHALDSNPE